MIKISIGPDYTSTFSTVVQNRGSVFVAVQPLEVAILGDSKTNGAISSISGMVKLPDLPRHIHRIHESSGQITIPKPIRDQFAVDEFMIFTTEENGREMIHLYPVEEQ